MSFLPDEDDSPIVNIYDFYRAHGLTDHVAMQVVLHMLLTRTMAFESDAREAASELGHVIPYIIPDNGTMH